MRNMTLAWTTVAVLACAAVHGAQTTADPNREISFAVAAVRPDSEPVRGQGGPGTSIRMLPGGRFEANTTLRRLISYAYDLRPHQRVEGTAPLLDQRFAIVARVADGVTLADGDERRLVQRLLADRFMLRVRFEEQAETVYLLRRASADRLGRGLRPSPLDCAVAVPVDPDLDRANPFRRCTNSFWILDNRVAMVVQSMAEFADLLSRVRGAPVVDETGLEGPWEIETTFDGATLRPGPSLVEASRLLPAFDTALRNDLGLTLDTERRLVPHLVVEHVEAPLPN